MFRLLTNLYYPPDSAVADGKSGLSNDDGKSGLSNELSKEDIIEFLKDDEDDNEASKALDLSTKKTNVTKDETKDDDKSDDDKSDDKSDKSLEDELEEELSEVTEDKLELVSPVRRQEILKKFPTLFKEFPYLEKAYYREQQFTSMFPTINDAKEAVEKVESFDNFEKDLIGGNIETILGSVKSESPEAFAKIADNYLATLAKVDNNAYLHILGNTVKSMVVEMANAAKSSNNEDLAKAAGELYKFVFNSTEFQPPTQLSKAKAEDDKSSDLNRRETEFNRQRFETSRGELNDRVTSTIKSTINKYIDTKGDMSEYIKGHAGEEALNSLGNLIDSDSRFKSIIDKLWEASIKQNFNKSSLDKIKDAYLSKARTLLPTVIQKARNNALKGMGVRRQADSTNDKDESVKSSDTKRRSASPSNSGVSGNKSDRDKAKAIPHDVRSIDFLMQD